MGSAHIYSSYSFAPLYIRVCAYGLRPYMFVYVFLLKTDRFYLACDLRYAFIKPSISPSITAEILPSS